MRILVVNLTRLGDLLQTQPVLSGLKARGHTVGLVCLQNFQGATALLRDLDAVFAIPGARLLAGLDRGWPEAVGELLAWSGQTREDFRPQACINLTPSLPGRLLARILTQGNITGFGMDVHGFGTYSSPWSAFLEASSRHRGCSPFNLVDLFWKSAHLGDGTRSFRLAEPSPDAVEKVRTLFAGASPPGHPDFLAQPDHPECSARPDHQTLPGQPGFGGYLGLQLGASAARRQWPVECFAALATALWEQWHLLPVLLGGKGEEPLAEAFRSSCKAPHVDLIGRTGLEELGAVVSGLRLLVTNDTGTMHLAAGLDVPILAIFLATAQPWDTGPYRPGCLCLEPDMPCHPCGFGQPCLLEEACRMHIPAQAALAFAEGFLRNGVWPELPGLGVRAWETVVEPDHFLGLRSRSGHGSSDRAIWNGVQRQAWRQFLDGEPVCLSGFQKAALTQGFQDTLLAELHQASGLLAVLRQQAEVLKVVNRPVMRTKFMATWQRLESLFSASPALSALGHLWLHLSQQQAEDISVFLELASRVENFITSLAQHLLIDRR